MSVSIEPFYNCTTDILTVYWPTDELYTATTLDPPQVLPDLLSKKLARRSGICQIF